MQTDTFKSIIRAVIQLIGSYVIGHALFGAAHVITADIWETVTSAVAIIATTIWGIYDKSASVDQAASAIRSAVTSLLGVATSWGVVSGQNAIAFATLAGALLPVILSYLDKVKTKKIANGKLTALQSGKVVKVIIFFALLLPAIAASAQSNGFFSPLTRYEKPKQNPFAKSLFDTVMVNPTTPKIKAFRPVTNVLSYFEGGKDGQILMAGIGFSYQWLHADAATGKWYADYSINGLLYGGANLSTQQEKIVNATAVDLPKTILAAGISVGFLNGLINTGFAYNFQLKRFGPTLGCNIQLNN